MPTLNSVPRRCQAALGTCRIKRVSDPEMRLSDRRADRFAGPLEISMESLILAQDERWRRASYMQVEREAGLRSRGKRRTGA